MVCTAARDAVLRDGPDLWFRLCVAEQKSYFGTSMFSHVGPAVVRNLPMRPYPNFQRVEGSLRSTAPVPITWQLRRASWGTLPGQAGEDFSPDERRKLAGHALREARLNFGARCGLCGDKSKHVPVWGLGIRVCSKCLKENLVSGAALFHECGFDFNQRATELSGKVFYFREAFRPKQLAALLSHNPVDFRQDGLRFHVFFWRPHLERVVDLEALRRQHRDPARAEAARRLTGAVQALRVRLFLAQKAKTLRVTDHSFHLRAPAAPLKRGGPYTVRPLTEAERHTVVQCMPLCCFRRNLVQRELDARRLLQESFVGYRGRCTLPLAKFADSTLEKLRALEVLRADQIVVKRPPCFEASTYEFRAWLDMAPVLS
jgi:hypothetical protein